MKKKDAPKPVNIIDRTSFRDSLVQELHDDITCVTYLQRVPI